MSQLERQHDTHCSDTGTLPPARLTEAVHHCLAAVACRVRRRDHPDVAGVTGIPAPTNGKVLVGVDDSRAGRFAVDHAAVEADLRHWDLQLLHIHLDGTALYPAGDQGARLLERMTERAHARAPGISVSGHLAIGAAATVLLMELSDTDMVVLGHHGGPATDAFGLSIGERVAARHRGPALVVRSSAQSTPAPGTAGRPLVVIADDPSSRTPVVDFARTEAKLRSCDLVVLHASRDDPVPPDRQDDEDGVRVRYHAVVGGPVTALEVASESAAAVIVGRHSGAGAGATSVGHIGRTLVREAVCPVFLVG